MHLRDDGECGTLSQDAASEWPAPCRRDPWSGGHHSGRRLEADGGHYDCIQALVRHPQIDIDARADYNGRTALIEAAGNWHLDAVTLLVEHGADVNAADKTGRNSALIEAIKGRHFAVAQYLLETRKVNFLNKDMRLNALIWAGSTRNAELIEQLDAAIHSFFEGK
ncbi:MAG: ankyrin repeat domain-containing protein [Mesorhizobium sp.]|nr:MAG: ankyrin repeat domain-containing protein [Mesorhizobium sp.]